MAFRNYAQEKETIKKFLVEFNNDNKENSTPKYITILAKVANRELNEIIIELDDVLQFNEGLANSIVQNTKRYLNMFYECAHELIPQYKTHESNNKTSLDVFVEHRKIAAAINNKYNNINNINNQNIINFNKNSNNNINDLNNNVNINDNLPADLLRYYDVFFRPFAHAPAVSVRRILSESIGKFVKFRGVVTRATEVKPLITTAAYVCDRCGAETFQPINSPAFTPLNICPTPHCSTAKTTSVLHLQSRGSKFVKFQELKVQELADQVPPGHVPRYLTVAAAGGITRAAVPGNHVTIAGIYLPVAKKGFRQIISGLITETYIEAHSIIVTASELDSENLPSLDKIQLKSLFESEMLYEKLAFSIAPEIFGHIDIKKALLLLMVGGVDQSPSGLKIRGNINTLLVGDPGVAKSQLLGYINKIFPRSQLTTGKGSSGVGLTAAVLKDPLTGDLVLEGGALVLSDLGICCIDEFDKMDENDRTAIHEVMEQQTISIAKAGISTTLNARVSILAAANPSYGRYNPKKTLEQNIQLPAALLSRFDLIWVIRDRADREQDMKLAEHILYVHQHKCHPESTLNVFPIETLRGFITKCKEINPVVPESLSDFIVAAYVQMRKESRTQTDVTYTSARTLLSILRLSTALARLRFSSVVVQEDVQEAIRLMECSKASVDQDNLPAKSSRPHDVIFGIIRELSQTLSTKTIDYDDVKKKCLAKGFKLDQFIKCIEDYEELNVLHVDSSMKNIILV